MKTMRLGSATPTVTITIDVHESDSPRAVDRCSAVLSERGLTATFFVPSALFEHPGLGPALRRLATSPHAIGSHGHLHDRREKRALREAEGLEFLSESRDRFEQFYGYTPRFFRSPCWCHVSDGALATLTELGYHVDCSSTPGRPGLLSSEPLTSPWLWSPRAAYFVNDSLLEVPTSCLLLPLASPTFLTIRRRASLALCRLLAWEATVRTGTIVNVMFHAGDFLDGWHYQQSPFTLRDVIPRRNGGCTWRRFLQTTDPQEIRICTDAVIAALTRNGTSTLREIYDRCAARR